MRASTAFFVGIGTVGIAIAGGLGGGLTIANMMSPSPPKHDTFVAKHDEAVKTDTAQVVKPTTPPQMSASGALPYAGATLAFSDPSIDGRPQQAIASAPAAAADNATKPAETADAKPTTPEVQPAAAARQASAPEDAYAKARDVDLKPDKHHPDRSQRWADRHHQDTNQQPNQQARDDRDDRGDRPPAYSYNYPDRRYRDDDRDRYRDDDERAPRVVEEGPRFGFPLQLFGGPDD